MSSSPAQALPLSVPRASALYIGALFGPGLLLLPGLAAQQAGPASIIAWVALLGLSAIFATVFAALGRKVPGAAGAAGYAAAGLGRRAAAMTRWWFLVGVVSGGPIVCLIGASYVTALTGGGPLARGAVAAGLLLAVLGLAVATVSCLGHGADLNVPLADLLQLAIGPVGRAVAAVAALLLTAGSVNAYISGATEMLRELTAVPSQKGPNAPGRPPRLSAHALLGIIALAGLLLIGLSALRLADIIALVSVPTAMFLCVYLSCTAAAARILTGPARVAAAVAVLAVLAVLAFCGWQALLAVAVVAAVACYPSAAGMARRTVSSSLPRSNPARTVLRPSRFSSCTASPVLRITPTPSSEVSRSPRSMPASCAGLPGCTEAMSSPARSDSPTAWRRARASRAGSSTSPMPAATSMVPDSKEESSRRSRPARTSRSAGD